MNTRRTHSLKADMKHELQKAGLTEKEAVIYMALLRLGESPISDILKETGFHPQIVYRALDGLRKKKLLLETYRRHRKYVRAEDPKLIERMAERELEEIRAIIPDLQMLLKFSADAIIRVERGNEAVRKLRQRGVDELTNGENYDVIGASGDRYFEVLGEFHAELERTRIKKGVVRRFISFKSQKALMEINEPNPKLLERRYLPEEYPIPTSTNIFGNTVAFVIWSHDPISIVIESSEVAQSYHHIFESLWKVAQP